MYKHVYVDYMSKIWKIEPDNWLALSSTAAAGKLFDLDAYGKVLKKTAHPLYRNKEGRIASSHPETHPVFRPADWDVQDWIDEERKMADMKYNYDGYKLGHPAWIIGRAGSQVRGTVVHVFKLHGKKFYVVQVETESDPVLEIRESVTMKRSAPDTIMPAREGTTTAVADVLDGSVYLRR